MKVPAIAKKSYDLLRNNPDFMEIVHDTISKIKKVPNPFKRAKYVHKTVDQYVEEVFSDPLVKQFSPCTQGCSACCHTQVSITSDEAQLLVKKIKNGVVIDTELLGLQAPVSADHYMDQLSFEQRKCVFLDSTGSCIVYEDRPSVCRTNAVIGKSDQCDTRSGQKELRLVLTSKADMTIYASFFIAEDSGTLPFMIQKELIKHQE